MEHLLKGRLAGETSVSDGDVGNCERWIADLRSRNGARLRAAQLEMEARLLRMALGRGWRTKARNGESGYAGSSPAAVQRMLEVIARRYTERLSIADIARPSCLHPNYASTLFRRTLGIAISVYLKQHRLFHARRLLAVSDKKLSMWPWRVVSERPAASTRLSSKPMAVRPKPCAARGVEGSPNTLLSRWERSLFFGYLHGHDCCLSEDLNLCRCPSV